MIEDVKRDVSPIRGVGSANTGWEKIWRLLEICAKIGNPWIYSMYNKITNSTNQICLCMLTDFQPAKRVGPMSLRAESARAVTGRRWGENCIAGWSSGGPSRSFLGPKLAQKSDFLCFTYIYNPKIGLQWTRAQKCLLKKINIDCWLNVFWAEWKEILDVQGKKTMHLLDCFALLKL